MSTYAHATHLTDVGAHLVQSVRVHWPELFVCVCMSVQTYNKPQRACVLVAIRPDSFLILLLFLSITFLLGAFLRCVAFARLA